MKKPKPPVVCYIVVCTRCGDVFETAAEDKTRCDVCRLPAPHNAPKQSNDDTDANGLAEWE